MSKFVLATSPHERTIVCHTHRMETSPLYLAAQPGITVAEHLGAGEVIALDKCCVCAFMGQTRTGPVGQAVMVTGVNDFRKTFGGEPASCSMALAVEQFFAAGGAELVVVRVVNGAVGARLDLPTSNGRLTLEARNPGTLESIRASVDKDRCAQGAPQTYTLVLQRLAGEHGRLVDQEIYRGVSNDHDAPDGLAYLLDASSIARPVGALDASQPLANDPGRYYEANQPGSNGGAPSDYDLVGCETDATGLFALSGLERLDFLYAPITSDARAPGVIWQAAALRACADRGAIVVVDPVTDIAGLSGLVPHSVSQNLLTYDQLPITKRGGSRPITVGASLLGMLAEATRGQPAAGVTAISRSLGRGLQLVDCRSARSTYGNTLKLGEGPDGRLRFFETTDVRLNLARVRLRLLIQKAIKEASRWLVLTEVGPLAWQRLEDQVGKYLVDLAGAGLIESDSNARSWFVQCNALTNATADNKRRETVFLYGYSPPGQREPEVFAVSQSLAGATLRSAAFSPVFRRPA